MGVDVVLDKQCLAFGKVWYFLSHLNNQPKLRILQGNFGNDSMKKIKASRKVVARTYRNTKQIYPFIVIETLLTSYHETDLALHNIINITLP